VESVYSAVRAESLYKNKQNSSLKGQQVRADRRKPRSGLQKLFVCGLFNDDVSNSVYVASHIGVTNGQQATVV
jgi:hypothetical protein